MAEDDEIDARIQAEKARQTDHDDLQNEIAGRDTGRMQRFLSGSAHGGREGSRRAAERDAQLTALEIMLMNDPVYAALYHEVETELSAAETATETALSNAQTRLSEATQELDELRENANRLPDGTRIYRDANGQVWTEDGKLVSGEELEGVEWKDGAPTYEQMLAQRNTVDQAQADIDAILHYQVHVLGAARDRLNDPDNPPTPEELQHILDQIREGAPEPVKKELEAQKMLDAGPKDFTDIKLPGPGQ